MIELPSDPGPAAINWQPQDFGGNQQGDLGGAIQRVNRLGNRWGVQITMPPMLPDDTLVWQAALMEGLEEGVSMMLCQLCDFDNSGAVAINGAGQSGKSIICDNATPGYIVKAGQFISVTTGGNSYCYMVASNARADAGGNLAIALTSRLRAEPADDDAVNVAAPKIEGLLAETPTWLYDASRLGLGFSFTIVEAR